MKWFKKDNNEMRLGVQEPFAPSNSPTSTSGFKLIIINIISLIVFGGIVLLGFKFFIVDGNNYLEKAVINDVYLFNRNKETPTPEPPKYEGIDDIELEEKVLINNDIKVINGENYVRYKNGYTGLGFFIPDYVYIVERTQETFDELNKLKQASKTIESKIGTKINIGDFYIKNKDNVIISIYLGNNELNSIIIGDYIVENAIKGLKSAGKINNRVVNYTYYSFNNYNMVMNGCLVSINYGENNLVFNVISRETDNFNDYIKIINTIISTLEKGKMNE
jgi:hypothetical protein